MTRSFLFILAFLASFSCREKTEITGLDTMNKVAEKYVELGLYIGQYDPDFVDAYYGPDSLKPIVPKKADFPKDSLIKVIDSLSTELKSIASTGENDSLKMRANWMISQLVALSRRVAIFSGEYGSFDEEAKDLFGVTVPVHDEKHFQQLISKFDSLLPGKEAISERFKKISERFIIPKDKLDTVFKTAIAEARKRTLAHYTLPTNEGFTLEYVTGKPWSGYNWYKGGYQSLIQINTDLPIFIERAIDLACHEGYPGHHVYNLLLEKNLYREKGWVEISLYPLFSPQSLIAEGSANYGIELAFPGNDQFDFIREILLPVAGLDTSGISRYLTALSYKNELNFARNEAARGLVNGTMKEDEALRWLTDYGLYTKESALKSISFIKKYRSYVINYNYGQQVIKNFIESKAVEVTSTDKRWKSFKWLLSNQVIPGDLITGKN